MDRSLDGAEGRLCVPNDRFCAAGNWNDGRGLGHDQDAQRPGHAEVQVRGAGMHLQEPVLTRVAGELGARTGQPEPCHPQRIDQVPRSR